jgi:hypothetical protein
VVVTGYKWISDSYSVQLPQYAALLVLHDPPGGLIVPVSLLYTPFLRICYEELGNSFQFRGMLHCVSILYSALALCMTIICLQN